MDPIASDVGLWVMGAGKVVLQGESKPAWAYAYQSSWAGDEVVAAPNTPGNYSSFSNVTGTPAKNALGYSTELLNLTPQRESAGHHRRLQPRVHPLDETVDRSGTPHSATWPRISGAATSQGVWDPFPHGGNGSRGSDGRRTGRPRHQGSRLRAPHVEWDHLQKYHRLQRERRGLLVGRGDVVRRHQLRSCGGGDHDGHGNPRQHSSARGLLPRQGERRLRDQLGRWRSRREDGAEPLRIHLARGR